MKVKKEFDTTSNSRVYKMALKRVRENEGEIWCAYCPYHRHENYVRYGKDNRNWKKYRTKQWRS